MGQARLAHDLVFTRENYDNVLNTTGEKRSPASRRARSCESSIHSAAVASLETACRQFQPSLQVAYAERGQYLSTRSLDTLSLRDPGFQGQIVGSLSAFESYDATPDGFFFIAIGTDGRARRPVTEREIERT